MPSGAFRTDFVNGNSSDTAEHVTRTSGSSNAERIRETDAEQSFTDGSRHEQFEQLSRAHDADKLFERFERIHGTNPLWNAQRRRAERL